MNLNNNFLERGLSRSGGRLVIDRKKEIISSIKDKLLVFLFFICLWVGIAIALKLILTGF